jgi:beta-apo-4'-carotenal oxygenase
MTSPSLPVVPFVPTPVESIAPTVSRLKDTFATLKTYPLSFREEQLRKLYWGIRDNEQGLVQALKADIGKPQTESMAAEIGWLLGDILYVLENLKRWAADESVEAPMLLRVLLSARVRKEPLGTVLVVGCVLLFILVSGGKNELEIRLSGFRRFLAFLPTDRCFFLWSGFVGII